MLGFIDIAEALRDRGYYKGASKEVIKDIFEIISEFLIRGESVTIRNFGTFEIKKTKGHNARDPVTNEIRPYEDFNRPVFRPSENLRAHIKQVGKMTDEEKEAYIRELFEKDDEE